MNGDVSVEFTGAVESRLTEELRQLASAELLQVFAEPRLEAVIVSRCYRGYSAVSRDRLVLGVEVRLGAEPGEGGAPGRPREFRTHIVKLLTPAKVESDVRGWERCTRGRDVASRILVPPHEVALGPGRVAVLYRDAYTLFGPDREQSRPESLETVAEWAVKDDKPDPVSVERAVAHVYTDLGRWFYAGAAPDRDRALAFYRSRLRRALGRWVCPDAGTGLGAALVLHTVLLRAALGEEGDANLCEFGRDRWRQELRRDATWLLCGRDLPDTPHDALYLDPYEYVSWALARKAVPETLVGSAHGDLHGRNVLLGVLRGEADYPAVFDYGEMSPDNVLAWDFVKLETELKVRLLPELYRDRKAREALLAGRSWRARQRSAPVNTASDAAGRADRLDFAYHFEKVLDDATAEVQGRADAELLHPPGNRRELVGNEKLDRLLALLLRVRQEAALWLGYERGRQHAWRDEYYFALAVYGLASAKWDYEPLQTECVLVSAGVAVARLGPARETVRRLVRDGGPVEDGYPSHRVPLAVAHREWKERRYADALALLDRVRPLYEHAVPLQQEYALMLAETQRWADARQLMEPFRALCRVFGDHETLCRIGRAYKSSGDGWWQREATLLAELPQSMAGRMYGQARKAYEEAFELSRHYYPGVNAATLALLLGDGDRAGEHARGVIASCQDPDSAVPEDEHFWVRVSEGEAWLVLGKCVEGAAFYEDALAGLDVSQAQMAQSAYDQLCRLWHVLGSSLRPVLSVFARSPLWSALTPGPVGDCDGFRGSADKPAPAP